MGSRGGVIQTHLRRHGQGESCPAERYLREYHTPLVTRR